MVDQASNQPQNPADNAAVPGSNPPGSGQFNALVTDLTTTGAGSSSP
jgi:hypothetical protein